MTERISQPKENLEKSQTSMEIAFANAVETKKKKVVPAEVVEPLMQIETKPGLAWTEPKEEAPQGRERAPIAPTDTRPLIQVETKIPMQEEISLNQEIPTLTDVVSEEEFERMRRGTEAPIIPNPEDAINQEHMRELFNTEGTPKEWREKLRGLVERAKEKIEWWKSSEKHLIQRSRELDAEAEKIGWVEGRFRAMGERYTTYNWKTKLAVGTSLGLGAAFSSGVSVPIALACLSGIAAQRAAGLATMFLKFEKNSHQERWGKEKAMLQAGIYTVLMGVAIKEAIEYVSETDVAHTVQAKLELAVQGWLGNMLGISEVPPSRLSVDTVTLAPETTPETATATAPTTPEISAIEIKATPGRGYEFMMKRLWEQLQEKHVGLPVNANPDSDLARLLAADKDSINTVVHNLAKDNEWFKENGMSASIGENAKMTIGTDGNIWINSDILASENAHMTPAYHTEAPSTPSTLGDATVLPEVAEMVPETDLQASPEVVVPSSASEQAVSPAWEQNYNQENQVPIEVHEAPVSTPASIANIITNKFNLSIPTTESHIYTNEAKSLFVYGGTAEQKMKMITEYLTKNPDKVIYAEDTNAHRVPWYRELGGKGKIINGPQMRTNGFAGFLSSLMKAPSPDDLKELIK